LLAEVLVALRGAPGPRLSALYGAVGLLRDPALTRVLLDAGADPNREPRRGDALYHSVEAEDTACLELLLAHRADPRGTNALLHALDYDRLEPVRLLLDGGADANEGAALVHAVRRGRGLDFVNLLVEHGADLDRRGGEWSTPRNQYKTPYQNAVLRGREDVAERLAELGAATELAPEDVAVAALVRSELPPDGLPRELSPDAEEAIAEAALNGRAELVARAVGPNFFGHFGGGPPGTLLHHAAWNGKAETVRKLLALGADARARSGAPFDTPLAWAVHGARHDHDRGDYVGVADALVAAGAELEPRFADEPAGALTGWLEERL
jgi:ankyrin repeat protein